MKDLRLGLALKDSPSSKLIVYASNKSNALTPLIFKSLQRLGDNFFFIHLKIGS